MYFNICISVDLIAALCMCIVIAALCMCVVAAVRSCSLKTEDVTCALTKVCSAQVQVNKDRELSISGERRQRASTASSCTSDDVEGQGSETSKASAPNMQRKRQERRFGSFKRTWNLPEDADVSQIRASVDQGVLTLVVNRVQPVEPEVTEIAIN